MYWKTLLIGCSNKTCRSFNMEWKNANMLLGLRLYGSRALYAVFMLSEYSPLNTKLFIVF